MYQSILNSKKIKYSILKDIIQPKLIGVMEINIFISLNSILKTFYSLKPDEVAESLQITKPNSLSSEIINIIAHYRHFFWSRFGIPSNYYIYYSDEMCNYCCSINKNYKSDYYDKRKGLSDIKEFITINEVINRNLSLIEILTEYLPNVYFINTKTFEPSALPQLLIDKNKQKEYIHNFILTNDSMDYQLCNNPYTSIISLNADRSRIIDQNNLMQVIMKKTKSENRNLITNVSSFFYVPVYSIAGFKKYNITGIKGHGPLRSLKKINKLIEDDLLSNICYNNMNEISDLLNLDKKLLNNNFKILSLKNISINISNKEFINIKKQLNNKSDNMSLLEINNKYYKSNPLMLIELMEGEE